MEIVNMSIGIYVWKLDGVEKYVGQSSNVERRMYDNHRGSKALFGAIAVYGYSSFEKEIITLCSLDELDSLETYYIKNLKTHVSQNGYNISWGGSSGMRGRKHNPESIEKNKSSHIGKSNSQESKNKLKETWKRRGHPFTGRTHSDETKKKISSAKLGSIAWNKGIKSGLPSPKRGVKGLGKSKYVGVSKKGKGFSARVGKDSERLYLYSSKIESDNATAYDIGAIYLYGNSCELNFPELRGEYISYLDNCNVSNGKDLIQAVRNYIERSNHGR
jgi:group I intron endonuclease